MASSINKLLNHTITKGPVYTKNIISYATPKLKTFWHYAKVEMKPPRADDMPKIQAQLQDIMAKFKTGKWKDLTVREAWLNALVAAEISFWFFAGEIIGRRSFYGYNV